MLGRPLVGSLAIGRLHAEVQRTFTASKMKLSIATGLGGTDYLELQVQCFEALLKPEEGRGAPTIWAKETKGLYRQATSADLASVTARAPSGASRW